MMPKVLAAVYHDHGVDRRYSRFATVGNEHPGDTQLPALFQAPGNFEKSHGCLLLPWSVRGIVRTYGSGALIAPVT